MLLQIPSNRETWFPIMIANDHCWRLGIIEDKIYFKDLHQGYEIGFKTSGSCNNLRSLRLQFPYLAELRSDNQTDSASESDKIKVFFPMPPPPILLLLAMILQVPPWHVVRTQAYLGNQSGKQERNP